MVVAEPRLLRQNQEVIAACLVEDTYLALLDEVDLIDALVEVDYDLVRLEDAAVHTDYNVVLEALLSLLEEELHVVCFEVCEQ